MESGIYSIKCIPNGKLYIGSAKIIKRRWCQHRAALNKHHRKVSKYLQNAWDKYGEDSFEFTVLEYCLEKDLLIRENYWVSRYDTLNREKGFNIEDPLRRSISAETKNKMSIAARNRKPMTNEQKTNLSVLNTGKNHPRCKTNKSIVLEIKERLDKGEKVLYLSSKYGLSNGTIVSIQNGKHWVLRSDKDES